MIPISTVRGPLFSITNQCLGTVESYDIYRIQAYLSRNKNENSGDAVFSNMGQFWWNGWPTAWNLCMRPDWVCHKRADAQDGLCMPLLFAYPEDRLLTFCLSLLPLWESVIVLCIVVRYFMSILVLQLSWWGRESWLLCLICLPGVSWWLSGSSSRCHGVVCSL